MTNKNIKILIVDDEESIRDSLKWHLEGMGYEVLTAKDPTLCPVYRHEKCTAKDRCADVLFIDQNMPGMTGAEFIRMQSERGCKLPASYKLIMTGSITDYVQALAESLGCQIVQKPFSLADAEVFVLKAKSAKESGADAQMA